jgi:tRNA(Ile)-lysidine synthase
VSRTENAIAADDADRAFECLRTFSTIVLAVSGGPDSLALLYLVADWIKRLCVDGPQVYVVTVDHGLRPSSGQEAQFVAAHATALKFPHTTLAWDGPKPASGIPNAARIARYRLLEGYARTLAPGNRVAVVTAHHEDDQAETLFMRLARGGGVAALAAMPFGRALDNLSDEPIQLVRPVLGFSKQRLMATLTARNVPWIDDPTNFNPGLERTRARAALASSGLGASALAMTARRMREAADGLAYAEAALEKTLQLSIERGIYARFDRKTFESAPLVLRQMFVRRLIGQFGGASAPPEHSEIDTLALRFKDGTKWSATLGGVMISAGSRFVRLWREPGRISEMPVMLKAGASLHWDGRFRVGFAGDADTAINVTALGRAGFEKIASELPGYDDLPSGAAYGLPAFYNGSTLLSVPVLGFAASKPDDFKALRFWSDPIHYANTD